ncbi:MAG: polyribonucleotide nucleotidyltransferase, partial [Anaerotruncus massiliensis (ex Togo et al. 2019)]
MFENYKVYEIEYGGKKMTFETGKMCCLSNASILVRWGETVVLCNVTASKKPREGIDFFPLSVDFEEKLYSVGKIPGSFIKREARPSDKAILNSRLVDRPIRPLFPKDMRNDCSVVMTVMSVDADCPPEIAGMCGVSLALTISDIPWNGPIAGVNVGLVDGEIVVCPTAEQRAKSDLHLTVAADEDVICMIEAGANEVANDVMLDAIIQGHTEIKKMVRKIKEIQAEIGKPKFAFESVKVPADLFEAVKEFAIEDVRAALDTDDKSVRDERLAPSRSASTRSSTTRRSPTPPTDEAFASQNSSSAASAPCAEAVDGPKWTIRPLAAEVGICPACTAPACSPAARRRCSPLHSGRHQGKDHGRRPEQTKRYMHHYNFPPYSVGEARAPRSPGRREIGHGALAERALVPVLPSLEEFPYTIRLVSEVLSSNGSTSQGSICGSTLALMDAGVPIKRPVAGISCGLITEGDRWMTMVDIQGLEDFFGDMDFKVGGTKKGITAIQMDLKIK